MGSTYVVFKHLNSLLLQRNKLKYQFYKNEKLLHKTKKNVKYLVQLKHRIQFLCFVRQNKSQLRFSFFYRRRKVPE